MPARSGDTVIDSSNAPVNDDAEKCHGPPLFSVARILKRDQSRCS